MLLEVACELLGHPITGVFICRGEPGDSKRDIKLGESCCNLEEFLEVDQTASTFSNSTSRVFGKDIQIELMRWFFARDHCG
jgi:hypothetical protein